MFRFMMKSALVLTAAAGLLSQGCTITECEEGDDCGLGGSGAGTTQDGPVAVNDLGSETINPDGDTEITISVPSGASSFALVGEGLGGELAIASKVTSPSGVTVFDFNADISTNRTDAQDRLYTLLVPTNPDVAVEEGDWIINMMSGGSEIDVNFTSVIKQQPNADFIVDLNLYFVGLDGLDAATAEADPGFQAIMSQVDGIYQSTGITVRSLTYNDITGADADTYGVLDSEDELAWMLGSVERKNEIAMNVFFVGDISYSAGLLGISLGAPGPPTLQGTEKSGVAANMASYLAATAMQDQELIDAASEELVRIIAHESGHFLGLFHTVEKNGLALGGDQLYGEDPISDTPLCADGADADMDMILDPSECAGSGSENLMFWSPPAGSYGLTSGQGTIMLANPTVH
jgi:hypothetical protein